MSASVQTRGPRRFGLGAARRQRESAGAACAIISEITCGFARRRRRRPKSASRRSSSPPAAARRSAPPRRRRAASVRRLPPREEHLARSPNLFRLTTSRPAAAPLAARRKSQARFHYRQRAAPDDEEGAWPRPPLSLWARRVCGPLKETTAITDCFQPTINCKNSRPAYRRLNPAATLPALALVLVRRRRRRPEIAGQHATLSRLWRPQARLGSAGSQSRGESGRESQRSA